MFVENIFIWVEWTAEWNVLYCERDILFLLQNKDFKIQLSIHQCNYWLRRFIDSINHFYLPKTYDTNEHIILLKKWCENTDDPLNTCIKPFISLVKMWNHFTVYFKDEKCVDFYNDLYIFLKEQTTVEKFLFHRLYDDDCNSLDDIVSECLDDMKNNDSFYHSLHNRDVTYELMVMEWFKTKKRRFPSHYQLFWMINDIEDDICSTHTSIEW